MTDPRDPIADLKRIAFLLEAMREPGYRIRAFRSAATALAGLSPEEVAQRAASGRLRELAGIGEVTERTILESLRGEVPVYLRRLETTEGRPQAEGRPSCGPRSRATSTPIPRRRMGTSRSARWPRRPWSSGTSTWSSATTRRA